MTDLYVTDERGRNVYYVHNLQTPSGGTIRTIRYDFGTKGHGIAFVARDCLDMLGYKYNDAKPNKQIYQFVSKENIINGKDTETKEVYIRTRCHIQRYQIKPVVLITLNGFFELVVKSNMPNAAIFQYWLNNVINDFIYRYNIYRGLIESDPNYVVTDGIPRRRGMRKFSKEQIDSINEYANKHDIDSIEAMYLLFD